MLTPLYGIILRMQKHLLSPIAATYHLPLHPSDTSRDIDPHARRPADKHTRPPSALVLESPEHVWDIRSAILGSPTFLLRAHGGHEGEAHEVLLEHGWRGGKAKVETLLGFGVRGWD